MSKHAAARDGDAFEPDPAETTSYTPAEETVVTPSEPYVASSTGREVTCPECGTVAHIAVNRRESHDFCATCDFPLFWTPNQVVIGDADLQAHAALRRLPGTAGRTTVGSLTCPHCAEANPVSGVLCLRCGGDLRPVAAVAAPLPEPVLPAPEPEPEPSGIPSWWWILGCATLAVLILVVVVLVRGS